jgi:hypothetical protein
VPCIYLDFRSNYVTVATLMRHWDIVIAEKVRVIEGCEEELRSLINSILRDPSLLFDPDIWPKMNAFAKVLPSEDLLPIRTRKTDSEGEWYSAVTLVSGVGAGHALWYPLPEIIASALLTGHAPYIQETFRIVGEGVLPSLRSVKLGGEIEIDPRKDPLYKVAVEE